MRVGVIPNNINNEYAYSSGCRAFALIRNLNDICELYDESKSYDIVMLQKIFDLKLINSIKKRGSVCVIDSCDSFIIGSQALQNNINLAMKLADAVTVPTSYLQQKIIKDIQKKSVYIGQDVMEFDYDMSFATRRELKTAVIYGSYHNVCTAKNICNYLNECFEKIIFISDNDHHLATLTSELKHNEKFEFIGWDRDNLFDIIGSAHVSIILYKTLIDGMHKSCNRTLISLFCGTPVISLMNPQVASLQEQLGKYIFEIKSFNNFQEVANKAIRQSKEMTEKDRVDLRNFGKDCQYGALESLSTWTQSFLEILEVNL